MNKLNVAVYTRVSTKHEEQISSLQNQQQHYLEYCDKHNYNLVKLYSDEGLSATSPNRKQFLEMMYDAGLDFEKEKNSNKVLYFTLSNRTPKFNLIITKDVSRFARNVSANDLAIKLKDKGVYILFENAGFSTQDNDWELRLGLLLTFSQQESIDRSKKVSFAYKQRSKNGVYHMTKNLYGYRYDPETKSVSIVEEEAENVRKMFELFINGDGVKRISNYLNENKIKTQNGYEWVGGNVRRLLRNEKYIGRVILNKFSNNGVTSGKKRIKRPESEWTVLEGAIEQIIDIDTWNKAQEVIMKRVDQTKEGSLLGSRKVKNIFYNKLYCGKCGKTFARHTSKKQRKEGIVTEYNYTCTNRRHRKSCDNKMISHNVLVRKITEFAKNELPDKLKEKRELFTAIINNQKQILKIKLKSSEKTVNNLKKQIAEIDIEVDKLLTAFSKSSSTVVAVIERKIEQLEITKNELNQQLLESDPIAIENELNRLNDVVINLTDKVKKSYSFDEALIYLGKITVIDGEITFNVVADEKLEPLLNIDVGRIGTSKLDSLIAKLNEELKNLR